MFEYGQWPQHEELHPIIERFDRYFKCMDVCVVLLSFVFVYVCVCVHVFIRPERVCLYVCVHVMCLFSDICGLLLTFIVS